MTNKINYLITAIENWYRNAKIDHDVTGSIVSITGDTENDSVDVTVIEDGEEITTRIDYVSDYSATQLYNVWMEAC